MTALKSYVGATWDLTDSAQIGPTPKYGTWIDFQSGYWYTTNGEHSSLTVTTNNRCYFLPFYVNKTTTFDQIACLTGSAFVGTAVWRLGVYSPRTNGRPYNVVFDAGTVSCTVASTTYSISINQTLTEGIYFMAGAVQTLATTTAMVSISGPTRNNWNAPLTSNVSNGFCGGFYIDGVSSSLIPVGNPLALNNVPAIRMRAA